MAAKWMGFFFQLAVISLNFYSGCSAPSSLPSSSQDSVHEHSNETKKQAQLVNNVNSDEIKTLLKDKITNYKLNFIRIATHVGSRDDARSMLSAPAIKRHREELYLG